VAHRATGPPAGARQLPVELRLFGEGRKHTSFISERMALSFRRGGDQLLLALAMTAALSGCVLPVTTFVSTSTVIAADSSADHRALLEAAWADQIAFETFRLQNLPRLFGPFRERPLCREHIGRFCLNPRDGF